MSDRIEVGFQTFVSEDGGQHRRPRRRSPALGRQPRWSGDIGVDELSYRKHHEYITVVLDHSAGRVVWAAPGKNAATLKEFFAALGAARSAKLKTVTMDMSQAYINALRACAPNARIVFDRFHVQRLAHDALDEVRRDQMRKLVGTD